MLDSNEKIAFNRTNILKTPSEPGVYIFYGKNNNPIYIGKSISLKSRLKNYIAKDIDLKTKTMVSRAVSFTYIKVFSEVEALVLEANLVGKYKPKYNIQLKDDKSPLYIYITKDKYPRVLKGRKADCIKDVNNVFGPYLSSKNADLVLKRLRKVFSFATHLPEKRPCFYSQIGLCDPCPSKIEIMPEPIKEMSRSTYLKNISNIKRFLRGQSKSIEYNMKKLMNKFSKAEKFEEAKSVLSTLTLFRDMTIKIRKPSVFFDNPLIKETEIRESLFDLRKEVNIHFLPQKQNLHRIECFDIAHLQGNFQTASMIVFCDGVPAKKYYRHFKVRHNKGNNDPFSMEEIAIRRFAHLKDWGRPDLVLVDGGKAQVSSFQKIAVKYGVPICGIAKLSGSLVIPTLQVEKGFRYKVISQSGKSYKDLLVFMKDEAHRFARKLHHNLLKKSYGF